MITHYDLFAGIGGFSLALERVFDEPVRHIFCEWEQFPTAVLKKHWPEAIYYGDITDLVADSECQGREGCGGKDTGRCRQLGREVQNQEQSILTGGFPCQPFSVAGRRKGTADDRYQWPNMFAVIRNVKPTWVIAENVRGLVTWNEGMVLEQVCTDLESEGYEVQPFIIPAVAVNAPHRRDRVWIIANLKHDGEPRAKESGKNRGTQPESPTRAKLPIYEYEGNGGVRETEVGRDAAATDSDGFGVSNGHREVQETDGEVPERHDHAEPSYTDRRNYPDWSRNWQEVAFATCDDSMDDGLSRIVDGVSYSGAKWRKESLKAYGNAIVPEVAMEVFRAIKEASDV